MFNATVFAILGLVFVTILAGMIALGDWAEKNHRVFRPVLWYREWSRKKGEYKLARAKMENRVKRAA